MPPRPYLNRLHSSDDLITTYEATRAGFVALALEKNRRAVPYIEDARDLQQMASKVKQPTDLLKVKDIEIALLAAAGLSDKSLAYLLPSDKIDAIQNLIENFLEPAGNKFVEELVFRFLLTRGDALGGSMRNVGGALAQRKLTRALLARLRNSGTTYSWQHSKTHQWAVMTADDLEIGFSLRGLGWESRGRPRTLLYNLTVPFIKNNIDLCLFNLAPAELEATQYTLPKSYLALGELKGGIDPAGADEHWKTARAALDRIRAAFAKKRHKPATFFIGAAVEKKMASEIWGQLQKGELSNAANLNDSAQVGSLAQWLCSL